MRIHLNFSNPYRQAVLPINYNLELSRFIRILLKTEKTFAMERQSSAQAGRGEISSGNMYSFSQLIIPRRKIMDDKIALCCSEFSWMITSPNEEFVNELSLALGHHDQLELAGLCFPLNFIKKSQTPAFSSGFGAFTCLSPVTAFGFFNPPRPGEKWPDRQFSGKDMNRFVSALRQETQKRMQLAGYVLTEDFPFQVTLDKEYLQRKKNRVTKLLTLQSGPGRQQVVRGVMTPLDVQSEPEVLRFIYDTGLGRLTEFGFGMLEEISGKGGTATVCDWKSREVNAFNFV